MKKKFFIFCFFLTLLFFLSSNNNTKIKNYFKFNLIDNFNKLCFSYIGFDKQKNIELFYIKSINKKNTEIEYFNFIPDKSKIISNMIIDNKNLILIASKSSIYSYQDNASDSKYKLVFEYSLFNNIGKTLIKGNSINYSKGKEEQKQFNIKYKIKPTFLFPLSSDFWYSLFFLDIDSLPDKINIGNIYFSMYSKSYLKKIDKINYKPLIFPFFSINNFIYNKQFIKSINFYTQSFFSTKDNLKLKLFEVQASGLYQLYIPEIRFSVLYFKYPLLLEWQMINQKGYLHKKLLSIFKIDQNKWENLKNFNNIKDILEFIISFKN